VSVYGGKLEEKLEEKREEGRKYNGKEI